MWIIKWNEKDEKFLKNILFPLVASVSNLCYVISALIFLVSSNNLHSLLKVWKPNF